MQYGIDWKFCDECEKVVYRQPDANWAACQHTWRNTDPRGVLGNIQAELAILDTPGLEKMYQIRTYQSPLEVEMLLSLLSYFSVKTVVEIGSCHGGTAAIWKEQLLADVICIDATFDLWLAGDLAVTKIAGDSRWPDTYDSLVSVLDGRPIDFLFIDGDHSYAMAKNDYKKYSPLVREGGVIAFHDADVLPDVKKVFDEIPNKKLLLRSMHGIGVVFK